MTLAEVSFASLAPILALVIFGVGVLYFLITQLIIPALKGENSTFLSKEATNLTGIYEPNEVLVHSSAGQVVVESQDTTNTQRQKTVAKNKPQKTTKAPVSATKTAKESKVAKSTKSAQTTKKVSKPKSPNTVKAQSTKPKAKTKK